MRSMLLLPALAALIAGCGSQPAGQGSAPTDRAPAEFRASANKICREFQAKADALGSPQTLPQAVDWIDAIRPLTDAEITGLRALSPPTADAATFRRMLDSYEPTMRLGDQLRAAAVAGNRHRFSVLAGVSVQRQRDYDALARSIGLTDCVGLRQQST
jgi:hypothetical protein